MRQLLWVGVLGLVGLGWTSRVLAHDDLPNPWDAARRSHSAYHDDLEHRAYHRQLEHRDAHRYPMTGWQHSQLHRGLRNEAIYDRHEHYSAHHSGDFDPRTYAGTSTFWRGGCTVPVPSVGVPYGAGYGPHGGGLTLQFGW